MTILNQFQKSGRQFLSILILGSGLVLGLCLSACQSTKVIPESQIEANKNLMLMNQGKKIAPGTRVLPPPAKTSNRSIYCESDLFLYSPLFRVPDTGQAFTFDGLDTVELAFFDKDRKIIQKSAFRVFNAEDTKLAKNHGNQTLMANTNLPLRVTSHRESKAILVRVPLQPKVDDNFATLDFQDSKNEFFAGHQKMSCSFDSMEKSLKK